MRHIMTTAARPISVLFVTSNRRSTAQPALGFTAPFLPRPDRSASAQPSSERSRRPTTAFLSIDDRQPLPSPPANRGAGVDTTRELSP
jgi:hypothetical protein